MTVQLKHRLQILGMTMCNMPQLDDKLVYKAVIKYGKDIYQLNMKVQNHTYEVDVLEDDIYLDSLTVMGGCLEEVVNLAIEAAENAKVEIVNNVIKFS